MPQEITFEFEKTIHAPVDLIYRAFTSSTALREWLCDISTTNAEVGGWIYLVWNRGYFASGYYTQLVPDEAVSFRWIGKGEPAWTQVDLAILPLSEDAHYKVVLHHSGIGDGISWEKAREEISKGWQMGLENLKSTLEEGRDLRFTERPLIGIYPDDNFELSAPSEKAQDVPVQFGVRVREVVPGYGADQAGLEADDVIVAIDGEPVDNIRTLLARMAEYKSGERISVTAYRKDEKKSFIIDTKPQKLEALPQTPEELAKELEIRITKELEALESVLDGVSDAEASFAPGPNEWSSKETLVHLIHNEREMHAWINDVVAGQERFQDEWSGDQLFRIRATLTTYPTIDDLMAEFRRSLKETVATVAFLDQSFTRRKASYWRLGMELLNMHNHIREHIGQIKDNIHAARLQMS
jgi:uncharacterized protein YndB with AHSA1/START domain